VTPACDLIWAVVSGFPEQKRSNRLLCMLQAYIDDSCLSEGPIGLLAGWIASASDWAKFSDDWEQALSMSPRLRYFKFSEATSLTGEFAAWSLPSRDERLRLLVNTIATYNPLGFATAVPHDLYQEGFRNHLDKVLRYPYFFLFNNIVADLTRYLAARGVSEKVDFIFDVQPGQSDAVWESWARLREAAPPDVKRLLCDYPIFRDDKTTLPLQAADLSVGWLRRQAISKFTGAELEEPVWAEKARDLQCIGRFWTPEMMEQMMELAKSMKAASLERSRNGEGAG
jgi:hypothetical protein